MGVGSGEKGIAARGASSRTGSNRLAPVAFGATGFFRSDPEIQISQAPRPLPGGPPLHPGASLHDRVLPGLGLSISQAARELGVARSTLHRLFAAEAAITPEMAARLARLTGIAAGHWLGLQQAHDLWHVERSLADVLRRIPAHVLPGTLRENIGATAHE